MKSTACRIPGYKTNFKLYLCGSIILGIRPMFSFVGYVGGPKWMHKVRECKHDACCVSRLQSCGAIIVGKTNMHELGAGLSGINPHYGYDRGAHWPARNPYKKSKIVGGSFSGSAAVVATGLLQFCAFHCLRSSLRSGWSERCDKESMT